MTTPVADVTTRRVFGDSIEKQNKTNTEDGDGEARHDCSGLTSPPDDEEWSQLESGVGIVPDCTTRR